MKTDFCDLLGIEHPIVAAPMGPDMTGPELVAAVSNAGGLGILQAQFCTPRVFREESRRVRALTAKPFGVNLLLHFPAEDQVAVCLDERRRKRGRNEIPAVSQLFVPSPFLRCLR